MKTITWEDKILTLKNYKEPLKAIPKSKGYGWYGTLACTIDGESVQCHECGELRVALPSHIRMRHKMSAVAYREKYQLAKSTALVSENFRVLLKQRELDYIKSLSEEEKKAYRKKCIERLKRARSLRSSFQPKKSLEQMNKEGGCPDQTLDQIKQVKEKLGRVPSKSDFIAEKGSQRFVHLAYKHFGSWENAIKMCKFDPKDDHRKRVATESVTRRKAYTDEELLEYLRMFAQENNQIPTGTDFKRGFLPSYNAYIKRFKTIENARRLAGVYEVISLDETKFHKENSKFYRTNV